MIIFDFDQTLVDTSTVEHLRASRNWKALMEQAVNLPVYDGVTELLHKLHEAGQQIAIVTKSPDMVPRAFIRAHGWPINIVIGYHDVQNRKPHPDGLLLAMTKAKAVADETYHVGDHSDDTEAARAANIVALGALWGCIDKEQLITSKPDVLFASVSDLHQYFIDRLYS